MSCLKPFFAATIVLALGLTAQASDEPIQYRSPSLLGARLHVVEFDPRHPGLDLFPVLAAKGRTLLQLAYLHRAQVVINGGYFNLDTGQSASTLIRDGRMLADPRDNRGLMRNPKLKPYLDRILKRSELQIFQSPSGLLLRIASPGEAAPSGLTLRDALGAGPRLLPANRMVDEGFVAYGPRGERLRDAITAFAPARRSAVGLLPNGHVVLVASETGLTLAGVRSVMQQLGCREALNLDGGASTGLVIKQGSGYVSPIPDHWVRSALILTHR